MFPAVKAYTIATNLEIKTACLLRH